MAIYEDGDEIRRLTIGIVDHMKFLHVIACDSM